MSEQATEGDAHDERKFTSEDLGKLLLRDSLAILLLMHGVAKISHGTGGIQRMLGAKGLPEFVAYGVFVGEIAAPALMLLGLFTRPAALVFALNMLVATLLVHSGDLARIGTTGGWRVELQALYLVGAVAVALLGPGRLSLSKGEGAWWR